MLKHATYIGPDVELRGEEAVITEGPTPGCVRAQFDNMNLEHNGVKLGFNWHDFQAADFAPDPEER